MTATPKPPAASEPMNHEPTEIPSIAADAARASVSPHTVHLELAASRPDGTLAPVMYLALPASAAAELALLLAKAVEGCVELRAAQAEVEVVAT